MGGLDVLVVWDMDVLVVWDVASDLDLDLDVDLAMLVLDVELAMLDLGLDVELVDDAYYGGDSSYHDVVSCPKVSYYGAYSYHGHGGVVYYGLFEDASETEDA